MNSSQTLNATTKLYGGSGIDPDKVLRLCLHPWHIRMLPVINFRQKGFGFGALVDALLLDAPAPALVPKIRVSIAALYVG